jgi:hypothetical protein
VLSAARPLDPFDHVGARAREGIAAEAVEHPDAGGRAHGGKLVGFAKQFGQRPRERDRVRRRHQPPGLPVEYRVRQLADRRGNYRQAGLHCFVRGDA